MAKKRNVHGDVLVPFLISPSAWTAMRTLSSWSSRECALDEGEDDGSDALGIAGDDDCREESAKTVPLHRDSRVCKSSQNGKPLRRAIQSRKGNPLMAIPTAR